MVVWMDEKRLELNSNYIIKRATSVINGTFKSIEYKKDINSFKEMSADSLELNDIAKCTLSLDRQIAVDPYNKNRHTGSFIIIDRYTNTTVGAGMIVSSVMNESEEKEEKIRDYTKAEIELNAYIRSNFPEWECKEILG
jgi:sulfate adenylyltransferase subunit 1